MAARLEARAGTAYEPGESLLRDEQLQLIFGCCHPSLSIEAQMALTLRCVAGLSTREIASAFLVSESTMAQRLVRAKKKIETAAIPFRIPPDNELLSRSNVVLNVIYLIFNEGYTSAEGDTLVSFDLCHEAIRLGQLLTELLPEDPEPLGLVALMLLLDARRDARTDLNGDLVLLADQDRSLWNQTSIAEAGRLLDRALRLDRPGAYQLQAAINALHAEAPSIAATDWRQIEHLYGSLYVLQPTPVVALNHGVALAEAEGPQRGLDHLARVAEALDGYQYFHSARADLLRRLERPEDARAAYTRALELTTNEAERRFLTGRLAEL